MLTTRRIALLSLVATIALPRRTTANGMDADFFGTLNCLTISDGDARLRCYDNNVRALKTDADAAERAVDAETHSWEGNGVSTLPPFKAARPWILSWTCSDHVSIEINRAGVQDEAEALVDVAASDATDHGRYY